MGFPIGLLSELSTCLILRPDEILPNYRKKLYDLIFIYFL